MQLFEEFLATRDLESKLAFEFGELSKALSGSSSTSWDHKTLPGRAQGFQWRDMKSGEGSPLPTLQKLEKHQERALLLHSLLNHEMLAAELMALQFIRFGNRLDRRHQVGLFQTIKDEIKHAQLYRGCLNKMGFDFGDFPANDFFWRKLSNVPNERQFTAAMALTFEQANLDYCQYYLSLFRQTQDQDLCQVLQTVYEDEIRHVKLGLVHHQKNHPGQTYWDSYLSELPQDLSATWARGSVSRGANTFDREGRRRAGFSSEDIDELYFYRLSRGRVPNLFWYDPLVESDLIGPPRRLQPSAKKSQMIFDLETLPTFFAKRDDVVLVQKSPSRSFLRQLDLWGFEIPEYRECLAANRLVNPQQAQRFKVETTRKQKLCPWGWSQQIATNQKTDLPFDPKILFSKVQHTELFMKLFVQLATTDQNLLEIVVPDTHVGQIQIIDKKSFGEIPQTLTDQLYFFRAQYGMSGQMARVLDPKRFLGLANAVLSQQQVGVLEPALDKVFDYSIQLEIDAHGQVRDHGLLRFLADHKGAYFGAHIGAFDRGLPDEVRKFVASAEFKQLNECVLATVAKFLEAHNYVGLAGIDCLVCRMPDGSLRVRPLLEVNPRYNMGYLALQLKQRVLPGRVGIWALLPRHQLKEDQLPHFQPRTKQGTQLFLESGFFVLNEVTTDTATLAGLMIAETPEKCEDALELLGFDLRQRKQKSYFLSMNPKL